MFLMTIAVSAAELSSRHSYQLTAFYEHKYAMFHPSNHTTGPTQVVSAQFIAQIAPLV